MSGIDSILNSQLFTFQKSHFILLKQAHRGYLNKFVDENPPAFEQLDATHRIYFTTKIRSPLRKRDSVNNREQTRLFNFP